jgi:Protein of unknown function (DUF4240)
MAVAGDIFAVRLAGGRFGVIRIIRARAKSFLVYCSTYLDRKPPSLDDPRLLKPVRQHRFHFTGEPALKWIPGKPPGRFKPIGHIAPSTAERRRECNTFGSKYWDIGDEAFSEWRWIHERRKFEGEMRKLEERQEEQDRKRRRAQKPKYMMREARFWSLIDALDWHHTGNDKKVVEPLVRSLAAASVREIKGFEERLAYSLFALDTKDHAGCMTKRASEYLSGDGFLYARCACVANGRRFYDEVRSDPRCFPTDREFETLLGVATLAYERKTGKDFEYETGCSYESFSNVRGWTPRKRKHLSR